MNVYLLYYLVFLILSLKIKDVILYMACQTECMFQVPISIKASPNTTPLDRILTWLPGILMSNSIGKRKRKAEFPQKYPTSSALGHLCDSDMSHISLSHY